MTGRVLSKRASFNVSADMAKAFDAFKKTNQITVEAAAWRMVIAAGFANIDKIGETMTSQAYYEGYNAGFRDLTAQVRKWLSKGDEP